MRVVNLIRLGLGWAPRPRVLPPDWGPARPRLGPTPSGPACRVGSSRAAPRHSAARENEPCRTDRQVPLYALSEVSYAYPATGGKLVLDGVSLAIGRGDYLAVAGPNGAGKSTLLRLLAGTLAPLSGDVTLDGRQLSRLPRRWVAQRIALLPQRLQLAFDATVEELVWLGRTPHSSPLGALRGPSAQDRQAVAAALEMTGTTRFHSRTFQSLSGGEQQRVGLALALAQQPEVLLLDEPTSHLDPGHALDILDLVARLQHERGLTVVAVFHDLNLAALYAGRIAVLHGGRLVADGPAASVLCPDVLQPVFGPRLRVIAHPDDTVPQVLPSRAPR